MTPTTPVTGVRPGLPPSRCRARGGGALHWDVDVRGKDGKEHELNVDAKTSEVTADRSEVTADRSDDGDHDHHGDDHHGNGRDD